MQTNFLTEDQWNLLYRLQEIQKFHNKSYCDYDFLLSNDVLTQEETTLFAQCKSKQKIHKYFYTSLMVVFLTSGIITFGAYFALAALVITPNLFLASFMSYLLLPIIAVVQYQYTLNNTEISAMSRILELQIMRFIILTHMII